jgi:hypothetical protein
MLVYMLCWLGTCTLVVTDNARTHSQSMHPPQSFYNKSLPVQRAVSWGPVRDHSKLHLYVMRVHTSTDTHTHTHTHTYTHDTHTHTHTHAHTYTHTQYCLFSHESKSCAVISVLEVQAELSPEIIQNYKRKKFKYIFYLYFNFIAIMQYLNLQYCIHLRINHMKNGIRKIFK